MSRSPLSRSTTLTTTTKTQSKTQRMAQGSQYYPSLVHQHNTLPQPPALSASGTFVLSSNPHDMLTTATTHDSPSPPSTSSSSGSRVEHPPVFSMPPPHSSQPTASYESRYQRDDRYEPPLTEDDVDPDRIVARHQIRRQFREAVTLRDGARPYRVCAFSFMQSRRR